MSDSEYVTVAKFAEMAGVKSETILRCYGDGPPGQGPQRVRHEGTLCFYRFQVENEIQKSGNRLKQLDVRTKAEPTRQERLARANANNEALRKARTGSTK